MRWTCAALRRSSRKRFLLELSKESSYTDRMKNKIYLMINKQSGRTIPLDSTEFNDAIQGQNEDGFYISILREFKYWMRKDYVVLEVDAF
jgi:hypothetical protein